MKGAKKIVIPLVFALVGTSFVAYSFLDTFVIPKEYKNVFNAGNGVPPNVGHTLLSAFPMFDNGRFMITDQCSVVKLKKRDILASKSSILYKFS